ncbi:hypothetical protein D3C71_879020 [compost metagenome]
MDTQRKRRDDHALAVGLGDGLGLDDQFAGFAPFGDGRLHRALRPLVATIFRAHGLKLTNAAHVALAPRGHAIAHPVFFALDGLAELVLLQLFLFQHLVAPFLEMGKAAIKTAGLATIEPDGRSRDFFEKTAVVRNQHQRAARLLQIALKPFDGRQIQMVGGFVQHQDIGFRRHHAGKGRTSRLTAGKACRMFLPREAEMLKKIGDAVGIVTWPEPRFGISLNRVVTDKVRRLFQITDGRGRMPENLTRLRFNETRSDLHQRRLARTVAPDKADAIARLYLEIGAIEQRGHAEGQLDVIEFQNWGCQGVRLRSDHKGGRARWLFRFSARNARGRHSRHWK